MSLLHFGTFQQRFPDERSCLTYLVTHRWNGHVTCPKCSYARGKIQVARRVWGCSKCGKQVSLVKGTLLEHSKKPLAAWFLAIQLFLDSKGSMTATQLMMLVEEVETYQTAWTWLRKLRVGAAELFRQDAERQEPTAAMLQQALPRSPLLGSNLFLIRQLLKRLEEVCPLEGREKRRWADHLKSWSECHGQRRAGLASFPLRTKELAFRLAVRPRLGLAAFMLMVLTPHGLFQVEGCL